MYTTRLATIVATTETLSSLAIKISHLFKYFYPVITYTVPRLGRLAQSSYDFAYNSIIFCAYFF
jgi:hypothetical protein